MIKYYYPRTVRAITIALLDMFNDIRVVKFDKDNNPISEKNVPVTFGPVEKYHQDRTEDHYFDANNVEHNQRYYLQIPRIALVPNGVVYDPERATGVNEWRYWMQESLDISESDLEEVVADYQPTPYNFTYTVYIKNDSMDYLSQILENILPYFNPTLMLRVKEFSFLNIERDIPVTLDGVGYDFIDDENAPDSRFVNATLTLTVKGFMYRPFITSKVIKVINSKYINMASDSVMEGFHTSGIATSGGIPITSAGIPIPPSALPTSADYWTSGYYSNDVKEFNWYKSIMPMTYETSSTNITINTYPQLPDGFDLLN